MPIRHWPAGERLNPKCPGQSTSNSAAAGWYPAGGVGVVVRVVVLVVVFQPWYSS
ncbi:MAG: DUF3309 family protein [Caldilineaceae bacterium SB0661_bin_32]|uniref:DUF3309 family protein n=1 Tax=Caldilineaceae bacterium SB0661_bin_32 TaxID=2605255 RepID=A0A6B1D2L9_9CHLR|nr:DUF3309 family protein [Caldilineaceae bacterium SB0661_bin_32]